MLAIRIEDTEPANNFSHRHPTFLRDLANAPLVFPKGFESGLKLSESNLLIANDFLPRPPSLPSQKLPESIFIHMCETVREIIKRLRTALGQLVGAFTQKRDDNRDELLRSRMSQFGLKIEVALSLEDSDGILR